MKCKREREKNPPGGDVRYTVATDTVKEPPENTYTYNIPKNYHVIKYPDQPEVENPVNTKEKTSPPTLEEQERLDHETINLYEILKFAWYDDPKKALRLHNTGADQNLIDRKIFEYAGFLIVNDLKSSANFDGFMRRLDGAVNWQTKSNEDADIAYDNLNHTRNNHS